MYILVSPFFKSFNATGLTYHVADFLSKDIEIGNIVEIPFKEKIELGVVLKKNIEIENKLNETKIKSIISIYNNNIFLSKYRTELLQWISDYYITNIHNSNNLFFPKNLVEKIRKQKLKIDNTEEYNYLYNHEIGLSTNQEKAFTEIKHSKNNKILFYGLTGSGKTEIYIKLIKECLEKGEQTLLLIPEIVLTNQISEKIKKVFSQDVIIINSTITDATKTKYWLAINSLKAKIIIGTRSALFYPYNNLGLIIIDEEHDNSYISDSAPRYNSIEVAEKITELNGNKLVLASGTPSIKSMYKGVKSEYKIVNLLEKYKNP